MAETIAIYLLLGAAAGLIAGLLGVGGGLIIVPVLVYQFTRQQLAPTHVTHIAVATSLATIVFTSLSSVWAHHKRGAVRWELFWRLAPGILLGAFLGAVLAKWMTAPVLRRFFAIFEWLVAAQLLLSLRPRPGRGLLRLPMMNLAGLLIGGLSALLGIGGGSLTVPFLVWCNVRMQEAVATSSACGLPIAVAGTLGFVVMGWLASSHIPDSLGYVYLPALFAIVTTSVMAAPLGARLAHYLPATILRRIFAIFLVLLGLYMFAPH